MSLSENKIHGLWSRKTGIFYYLETGPLHIARPTDRIRSSLAALGLINEQFKGRTTMGDEPYLYMTMAEAKQKGYVCEPIYLNDHVKGVMEEKEDDGESVWDF